MTATAFEAGQRVRYTGRFGEAIPARVVRPVSFVIDNGQRLRRWLVRLDGIGMVHATDAMLAPESEPEAEQPKQRRRRKPAAEQDPAPVEPGDDTPPDAT